MTCEYKLSGWRKCQRPGSYIHASVRSTADGGTITSYQRRCSDHAEAADKDIHTWTNERMMHAAQQLTKQKQDKERRVLLIVELAKAERIRREREQGITCTRTRGIEVRL